MQTPPGFNHPARIAERISMLDLVSDARVAFGTGESSSEAELGSVVLDPEQERAMWEAGTRVALRCMTEEPFTGHSGEFVTMPPRNVVPKPRQKPHPPVWVACSRRDTIHLAATKGIGALAFAFINPEEAKFWVDDYYTTLANECVPIGDVVNPNLACVTTFMCHPDEDVALARGSRRSRAAWPSAWAATTSTRGSRTSPERRPSAAARRSTAWKTSSADGAHQHGKLGRASQFHHMGGAL